MILNGIPVKENSRQNVRSHEGAVNHAWLWVYGKDGTVYWLDPTWTDNTGYVWWGVVRNGREEQYAPSARYCMVAVDPGGAGFADFNRGNAAKNMSNYDRAIADYTDALRKDPNDAAAYYNRGIAHNNKGMHDRAIEDFNAALRLNPNDAAAYNNRGAAYLYKGMYDQAIADYNAALRLNPNNALAYTIRADAYWRKKDHRRAKENYERALQIDPNNATARTNLERLRQMGY
jgi:tetratricopeptide (TPR) repeat protein